LHTILLILSATSSEWFTIWTDLTKQSAYNMTITACSSCVSNQFRFYYYCEKKQHVNADKKKLLIERGKAVTWTHLNRALCGHSELWNEDTVIPPNIRIWLSNNAASFHRNEFSHLCRDLKTCNTWKRIFLCNKNILKCNNILW
jgi:hypothetical protein